MPALRDEDVRGLDVTVNDTLGVGGVQSVGNLDPKRKDRLQFHGAGGDQMLEGRAVEELHDEESAASFLADVVNGADIGMVESGCSFGFAAKTLQRLAVLRQVFGKKLESDEAAETSVLGLVNHAHTAAAKLFNDPVMRNGLVEQC